MLTGLDTVVAWQPLLARLFGGVTAIVLSAQAPLDVVVSWLQWFNNLSITCNIHKGRNPRKCQPQKEHEIFNFTRVECTASIESTLKYNNHI